MTLRRLASLSLLLFVNLVIGFMYMHSNGVVTMTSGFSNETSVYNVTNPISAETILNFSLTTTKGITPKMEFPHIYKYLINASDLCSKSSKIRGKISVLIMVCTAVRNFKERDAIRETWGSVAIANKSTSYVRLAFLLGATENDSLQQQLEKESQQHGDIIQQDFIDSYNNLTLKSIMLLKWVTDFCSDVHYVLKTDDDMYVNVLNLINTLLRLPIKSNVMYGVLFRKAKPNRNPNAKWFVPKDQFQDEVFPDYLSGTGYVISRDIIPKLYESSTTLPFLVMEDVFITGLCASQCGVKRYNVRGFAHWRRSPTGCAFKDVVTGHHVSSIEMRKIWKELHKKSLVCRLNKKP